MGEVEVLQDELEGEEAGAVVELVEEAGGAEEGAGAVVPAMERCVADVADG